MKNIIAILAAITIVCCATVVNGAHHPGRVTVGVGVVAPHYAPHYYAPQYNYPRYGYGYGLNLNLGYGYYPYYYAPAPVAQPQTYYDPATGIWYYYDPTYGWRPYTY